MIVRWSDDRICELSTGRLAGECQSGRRWERSVSTGHARVFPWPQLVELIKGAVPV
jgi:hypothetical protein